MTRVLVVEDEPSIRQLICYALADEGYYVDEAANGRAGLEMAAQEPPDVIVLDMKMPVMDGWEFARLYRARAERHAAIIVLTAAKDAARWAADVCAEAYLAKPFDLDMLVERVALLAGRAGPRAPGARA